MGDNLAHRASVAYYRMLVLVTTTSICAGAPAQHEKSSVPSPTTTSSVLAVPQRMPGLVATSSLGGRSPTSDYDYLDIRPPTGAQSPAPAANPSRRRPPALDPPGTRHHQLAPSSTNNAPPPPAAPSLPRLGGVEGIWGEEYEWLRQQVGRLHRHGLLAQLDSLQEKYPRVNLTLLYQHFQRGGVDYDIDLNQHLHHNGSYQWRSFHGDSDDGYWYNGTLYAGEREIPDREDGYLYNGTWYAGEQDLEDGGFHNGTYYPGEEEMADAEDGYYHNGTYYPGGEEDEDGQGRKIWWQQQHLPGSDVAANTVHEKQPSTHLHREQLPTRKWHGSSGLLAPQRPHQQHQQRQQYQHQRQQQQQQHQQQQVPQQLPTAQQRPPPTKPNTAEATKVASRPSALPQQPRANPPAQQLQGGDISNINAKPGNAALSGHEPQTGQAPRPEPISIPPAVSWGIVLAAILGAFVILAPFACLLYKYRQGRTIKKRTFLKRPEHGSVDDGILDALVMKELGEKKDSRVRKVENTNWGRQVIGGAKRKHGSEYRTSYELKTLPTSTTSAYVHNEAGASIT